MIVPELHSHIDKMVGEGPERPGICGSDGSHATLANFQPVWSKATEAAGLEGVHFHDLRHAGNSFAARPSNLREVMTRMGHSSSRAALIYEHATPEREIGAAVSRMIEDALDQARKGHIGGTNGDDDDGGAGVPAVVG